MSIAFWNINGISKIQNMDSNEMNLLLQWDVICLSETWVTEEPSVDKLKGH